MAHIRRWAAVVALTLASGAAAPAQFGEQPRRGPYGGPDAHDIPQYKIDTERFRQYQQAQAEQLGREMGGRVSDSLTMVRVVIWTIGLGGTIAALITFGSKVLRPRGKSEADLAASDPWVAARMRNADTGPELGVRRPAADSPPLPPMGRAPVGLRTAAYGPRPWAGKVDQKNG